MATRTVTTHVDIAATPAEVWAVLSDWPSHDRWNPFMKKVSCEPKVGGKIRFNAHVAGRPIPIVARLESYEPERELVWSGPGPGIQSRVFRGRHWVRLEATESGTRVHHGEEFGGAIPTMLWWVLERRLMPSYIGMNAWLKDEVEKG